LTQDTFKQKINFLIDLLNEIDRKVKKKIEDTTKNASNKDTNEIKEINDITIDSGEELVTLNITDQEGHIIYSYILRFTREGKGVTIANGSGNDSDSGKPEESKVINMQQGKNVTGDDSNKSEDNEDTKATISDSNEVTNVSSSDSDKQKNTRTLPEFTKLSEQIRGGGRDAINDQYTIPTTVLTAKMNEPFTINDNTFIISN